VDRHEATLKALLPLFTLHVFWSLVIWKYGDGKGSSRKSEHPLEAIGMA